jgi:formylglycine-generating enzyme required for sulfatase activity
VAVPPTSSARCDGVEAPVGNETRCLKSSDAFKDCETCPEMVVVPAGEFMMGSPRAEDGRSDNEGPQHKVVIARPFAVGKVEVTFAEWDACLVTGSCRYKPADRGWGRGNRPLVYVSWEDTKNYVAWLSHKTGKTYRLLTEAEWEYAARAGSSTPFSNGQTITTGQANFLIGGGVEATRGQMFRAMTTVVGSFEPNAFGLHDMHGNVSEWVEDCWRSDYKGAPGDGSEWLSSCSQKERVLRGGSWRDRSSRIRSAARDWNTSDNRFDTIGFRVARSLP